MEMCQIGEIFRFLLVCATGMDDHVFSWEEKNEALKKKMQHLERTWVDVNGEVENASKQGDTPYERVTGWMKDVTSLQEEMKKWQACLDEGGLRTDGEKCPNVWKSYQRTKQAEKLLGEVEALNATGDEIIKSAVAIKSIGEAATASSHGYNMQGSQASTDAVLKRRQEAPDLNGKPHSEAVGGSFREAAAESSCDHDVQGSQGGTDAATHSHEAQDLSEVAAGSYGDNDMRGSKDSTQAVNHRQEAQGLKRAMGYAIKCAITKHASRGIHHLRSQCAIHGRPPSTHNGTVRARIRLVRSTLRSTQNFRNRKGDVAESSKGHDTQGSIASKDKEGSTGLEDAEIADTIIGIDLGTTCSCVGVYKDGHIKIIADDQGNCFTPSCVAFTDSGRLIGEAAKNQATMNAERTIFNVKRLIGRKFEDEEVQRDMKLVPYKIVNKDGKPYIQVKVRDGEIKVFSPQEITAMVLTKMKEISEAFLGKKIKDAVISVPVHFNFAQRQATKDAAIIAGLNVRRIINEPTAAALAYRLPVKGGTEKILVFDLGGGTLDVSILTLIGSDHFYVDATSGDIHLGGEDFGQRVMEYFIKLIKEKHGKDISADNCALGKLRSECERAKRILSSEHQVTVEIKSLYDGMDFSEPLTRDQFEELNGDLFRKIKMRVKKALKEAECEKHEIVEIVLVGGSTRIPKVQQLLKDYFDGKEPNRRVNPDEAVTYGAAALGGSLKGRGGDETEGIRLTERLSFQLRFESKCGTVSRFAVKSSSIPWKTYAKFTTTEDQQTIVPIKVFEGEGTCLKDCRCLGEFNLTGIQPAPRGATEIEITFHLDSNGIPDATAEVVDTEESITVTSNFGGLSQEEIKRMVREAKEFAEEDKKVKENIDARSQLETYIYDTKNTINDRDKLADKLKSEEKENVEAALKDVLQWLDDNRNPRKEDYDEKLKEVKAICDPIVSAVYQRSGCGPGGSPHDALALNGA